MKRYFFLGFALILGLISCDKDEDIGSTIIGTWNKTFTIRYDNKGDVYSEESLDTIRIEKLSISDFVIQEMYVDTIRQFYFLIYSSYEFENGQLKKYPDSLIDNDMNKYYWNPADSMFGTFPVKSYPFESSINHNNSNNKFIENRVFDDFKSMDIFYDRLDEKSIDLISEFGKYNTLKAHGISMNKKLKSNKSENGNMEETPVYNNVYK